MARKYNLTRRIIDCVPLKEIRLKANMTQIEVGSALGIEQAEYSRIERGIDGRTLTSLYRVADALNCDVQINFVPRVNNDG